MNTRELADALHEVNVQDIPAFFADRDISLAVIRTIAANMCRDETEEARMITGIVIGIAIAEAR